MENWLYFFIVHSKDLIPLNFLMISCFLFLCLSWIVCKDPSTDPRISRWTQSLLLLPVQRQQRQAAVQLWLHPPVCLWVSSTHKSFHSRPRMEFVVNLVWDSDHRTLPNTGLSLQHNSSQNHCQATLKQDYNNTQTLQCYDWPQRCDL